MFTSRMTSSSLKSSIPDGAFVAACVEVYDGDEQATP